MGDFYSVEWGASGRLAHVMDGPFAGRLVLVWPEGDRFWFALDRPVEGQSDVRFVGAQEAAELTVQWALEWIPKTRQEARLEARQFGIRPEMNPANRSFVGSSDELSVEPISRAVSPGARWVAFPTHLFFCSALLGGPLIAPEQMEPLGAFVLVFLLLGGVSALLAIRSWFLRVVVTDREVVVYGWMGVKRFPRDEIVGFSVGEYKGGFFGMYWSTYDHNFVSLRAIGAAGEVVSLHAIFGRRQRRMVRIASGLDAYIQRSVMNTQ